MTSRVPPYTARIVVAVVLLTSLGATVTPSQAAGPTMSVIDLPQHSTPAGNPGGFPTQSLSRDGRYLLYTRNEGSIAQVELYDRKTRRNQILSATRSGQSGNANSWAPVMTPDLRYVAFYSMASNLVGTKNPHGGVFFLDRTHKTLHLLNLLSNGKEPSGGNVPIQGHWLDITANGRTVVFEDDGGYVPGEDTAHVYYPHYYAVNTAGRPVVRYLVVDALGKPVDASDYDVIAGPQLSDDGTRFTFTSPDALNSGDPTTYLHVYVYDERTRRASLLVSATSTREDFAYPSIDGDGKLVTYATCTSDEVDPLNRTAGPNTEVLTDVSQQNRCQIDPIVNARQDAVDDLSGDVWVSPVGQAGTARDAKAYASALVTAGKPTISRDGSTVYFLGMNQQDIENDQVSVWRWVLKTNTVSRFTGLYCNTATAPDSGCLTSPAGGYDPNCRLLGSCSADGNLDALQVPSTDPRGGTVVFRTSGVLSSADRNGAGPSIYLMSGGG